MSKRFMMTLLFGLVITMLFSGCRKADGFDAKKYRNYICSDSNLACLDAKDDAATEYITFSDGDSYYFTYRQAVDVSDDQFICITMKDSFPLSKRESYIFQNPENYIDVWTAWTIKEIQIYYQDINKSVSLPEEAEPARTPNGIVVTTRDEACIAELLEFITGDEYQSLSTIRENMDSVDGFYAVDFDDDSSVFVTMYVRAIFNESETIVWDSKVMCYENYETKEQFVTLCKDTTVWDENTDYCGINFEEFCVENLPNLEKFMLNAVDALITELGND